MIVNSTSNLNLNGPLSKAILEGAGEFLLTELKVNYPNGISAKKVAVTTAGNIQNVKAIFHITLQPFYAYPNYKISKHIEKTNPIGSVVNECLKKLIKRGYESITIPAIGAGYLGYTIEFVAKSLLESVFSFLMANYKKKLVVRIVIFEKDLKKFQVIKRKFNYNI